MHHQTVCQNPNISMNKIYVCVCVCVCVCIDMPACACLYCHHVCPPLLQQTLHRSSHIGVYLCETLRLSVTRVSWLTYAKYLMPSGAKNGFKWSDLPSTPLTLTLLLSLCSLPPLTHMLSTLIFNNWQLALTLNPASCLSGPTHSSPLLLTL